MEEKETKIKEEIPKEQKEQKIIEEKKPELQELNNQTIYDQYKKDNVKANTEKKEEKVYENEKENNPQTNDIQRSIAKENNTNPNININNNSVEKSKRHRRGKNEINDRNYRCPDCDKCYLSGPALTTHRKTKHGYGNNGEKRNRGRPKKDGQSENNQNNPLIKYNNFFNDEKRKPVQTSNDIIINIDKIKEFLQKIFNQCKKELFTNIENLDKYSFYELIIQNWDKENPFPNQECFSAITKIGEPSIKVQNYNLDELFFLYLKEFSKKTNEEYFWFMIKFIVLFRECINKLRNNLVKNEDKTDKKELYTQIYNAETVPEICNDFFVEFMEPYDFFGLYKEELIELIQHFCYWLFSNQYAQSHLTLLDS